MRRLRLAIVLLVGMSAAGCAQTTAAAAPRQPFQIRGTVVDALSGEPLAGAQVAITLAERRDPPVSVVTGSDGRFLFPGLAPGKYVLMAQRHGYRLQPYHQHEGYSVGIAVGPALDSSHIVFPLSADAAIAGRIVDDNDDPVAGAEVRLFREQAPEGVRATLSVAEVNTDQSGYFHFGHLGQGTYMLAATARPWYAIPYYSASSTAATQGSGSRSALDVAFPVTFYPDVTEAEQAAPIVLRPGERARADMVMRAVPAVHLHLASGGPNEQGLSLSQPVFGETEPAPQDSYVAADGSVEVGGLAPGRYLIAQGEAVASMGLTGDAQITPATFSALVSLSGIVDLGNQPRPPELKVVLTHRESRAVVEAEVRKDGQFEQMGSLAPGVYDVSFGEGATLQVGSMAARGAEVRGHTLRVGGADPIQLAVVAAQGAGRVQGVARRDGKPMAGAMVLLVPADPENDRALFRRDQSDSDGTFTLANAQPGKYTVVAIADGWDLEWARPSVLARYLARGVPVEVQAGKSARVEVSVQPK